MRNALKIKDPNGLKENRIENTILTLIKRELEWLSLYQSIFQNKQRDHFLGTKGRTRQRTEGS